MSDEKPIGVRVQRPYATREEYLDAEADLLGRSHVTLVGTKPRAPGTLLRFEVVLLSGEPVIRAEGRVVGPREIGTETGLQVKLTRIDNRTKAILDEAAQRKAAKSVVPPRNPSQADTAPPPAPAAGPPPLPAAARSAVPPPLPIPEERRSGEDVVSAATQELAALLEPEPEAPSAPATDPEAAADSEPAASEPEAAEPEPEPPADVEAESAPEPEPEPEPAAAPEPAPEPESAQEPQPESEPEPEPEPAVAFPAPDPVLAAAPPAVPEPVAARHHEEPATGPHDRNALLARLRSRLRHDA